MRSSHKFITLGKSGLFFILIFICCSSCSDTSQFSSAAFLLENIHVIDPIEGNLGKKNLLIDNQEIVKILETSDDTHDKRLKVIDGEGQFVMPGLWDAHVHFDFDKAIAPKMLDLFLGYGIMYVRDTGGQIDIVKSWKDKAAANPTRYPDVKIAGPLIDGKFNVYDGHSASAPELSVQMKDTADIRKMVELLVENDVDLLKAYEMLTPAQFDYIMELADKYDLKVTGHVPLSMTVQEASNLGFNSMEHFRNIELSCSSEALQLLKQRQSLLENKDDLKGYVLRSNIHAAQRIRAIETNDEQVTDDVLSTLKRNDTWQIPTLTLYIALGERPYLTGEWIKSYDYLPDTVKQRWINQINQMSLEPPTENLMKQLNWYREIFSKVHYKGITMMAGTDTPIFYLTPGLSLHEELRHMVNYGMTPLEAIQSATTNPAKYFKLDNEIGRIKAGYKADLLVLDKNPLEDIRHTLSINKVVRNGKVWDSEALESILKAK